MPGRLYRGFMAKEIETIRTQEVLSVPGRRRNVWKWLWFPSALILALSAGGLTGVLASYYLNNSRFATEVTALATYRPPQVTRIYADDGETVLSEFFLEKRIPIKEQDVPKVVEDALLSVEDYRFYEHNGIDPQRIATAAGKFLLGSRMEGASTITQQLAKNLFLYKDQTLTRKVNEWAMALEIERFYTKKQILEMYMNYVFLGAGSYGFEAGARTYFGKSLKDVNLEEAALLAAIPKSPEYSPTRNMDKALERRNIVLDQMAKYGKITDSEAREAKAKPIKLADTAYYQSIPKSTAWDFPVEEMRKELEEKYTTRVAQGGLEVFSTINVDAQKLATKTIRAGLRRFDQSRGWRSDYQNVLVDDENQPIIDPKTVDQKLKSYKHADWYGDSYDKGEFIKGLVMKVDPVKDEATVRFGKYTATVTAKDMGRSKKRPKDELKVGFLPEFEIVDANNDAKTLKVTLSQVPDVESALVSLNSHTGEIVAMVGGYDFYTKKFNNATQGLRQTGSAFKPFIYTAAVEWGMTPDSIVSGAPIKRGGWMPHNYDGSFSHPNVPLKVALMKSLNIAAVHLLDQVGIQTGSQMVRRFGITRPMAPVLPSALGATEVPLIEMVSAYSAFPNKGIRVEPHMIRKVLDRDGKILEEWEKTTSKVTSEYVALTMVQLMRGVCGPGGTAAAAQAAGQPLGGKTGTVNDHTDVWFIGYTPTYVTGVWMGNPLKKESLGPNMTGGHGALPMFSEFMNPFMKGKPIEKFPDAPPMPADVKALAEQRKREEQEKLENAQEAGKNTGVPFTQSKYKAPRFDKTGGTTKTDTVNTDGTVPGEDNGKTTTTVPHVEETPKVIIKPQTRETPIKHTETVPEKPKSEGPKKKGKKGEDDRR
jgi:penicillin-binding protein 1A